MFTVVAKFDEILHVHRNEANRTTPRHTVFSFMSSFKYTPYVEVPGYPRLENGMRVVALLRNEDDWKSLIGWRDLDTGELVTPDPRFHLQRAAFFSLWTAGLTFMVTRCWKGAAEELWPLLMPLLGAAFAILEFKRWRSTKLHVRALEKLPHEA